MKYKLLLLGTHYAAIDDFFRQMDTYFELLSTSLHYEDIKGHFKYFKPDAVVYCLHREARDNIIKLVTLKKDKKNADVPMIILGDEEDCEDFNKVAMNIADLCLVKPLNATMIQERINKFLDELALENQQSELETEKLLDSVREAAAAEAQNSDVEAGGAVSSGDRTEEKKHILIVDDDIRMLKVLKRHLEGEYITATAVNGKIALRYLESKPADLILLDYIMPELSGPEVLEKIRENPKLENIPVLFLTGAAERGKIQKALSMKPQGYMLKPVERDSLLAKIKELIG